MDFRDRAGCVNNTSFPLNKLTCAFLMYFPNFPGSRKFLHGDSAAIFVVDKTELANQRLARTIRAGKYNRAEQ